MTRITTQLAVAGLLAWLIILGTTVRASGQTMVPAPFAATAPETADEEMTAEHWYGWSLLLSDALTVTAAVSGELLENDGDDGEGNGGPSETAYLLAGLNYLITPQVLHGFQGSAGNNLASGALRLTLPLLGAALGSGRADCGETENACGLQQAAVGFIAGGLFAMVLDASLAWGQRPVPESMIASAKGSGPSFSMSPCTGLAATSKVQCTSGSLSFNLGGAF